MYAPPERDPRSLANSLPTEEAATVLLPFVVATVPFAATESEAMGGDWDLRLRSGGDGERARGDGEGDLVVSRARDESRIFMPTYLLRFPGRSSGTGPWEADDDLDLVGPAEPAGEGDRDIL